MSWKNLPYWKKGAFIFSILSILISLSPLRYIIYVFLGALIFGTTNLEYLVFKNPNLESLQVNLFGIISMSFISLVIFFLLGAIFGWTIGKIKFGGKNEQENKK
mgnify:CR=1 FL=1